MRAKIVLLAVLAGIWLSSGHEAAADAQNLSCITDESVFARRVLRDCGPEPLPLLSVFVSPDTPQPPEPPLIMPHDGNRKSDRAGGGGHGAEPQGGGGQAGGGSPN